MKNILLIVLLAGSPLAISAQDGSKLKYLVREPTVKSEKPPLLVLLHGFGGNESNFFSLSGRMPGEYLVISVRAPVALDDGGYAWFPVDFSSGKRTGDTARAEKSRMALIRFLEGLIKELHYDPQRVYLCGFSQGGIMSFNVALTRPDLVKGIAVLSGRLAEQIKPKMAPKEKLKPLKIYIAHGTMDNVLGIDLAYSAVAYLKTLGFQPRYNEYRAGHEINEAMLADLVKWLEEN